MIIPELVQLWDKTTRVHVDSVHGALKIIVPEHHEIHEAGAWTCSGKASVDSGADLDILLDNPADNLPHLRNYKIVSTVNPCDVYIYEGTTVSANGSEQTVLANNRTNIVTSAMKIYTGPTVTGVGTEMEYSLITSGKNAGGLFEDIAVEWDLKANEKYLIRYTNNSATTATVGYYLFWYVPT